MSKKHMNQKDLIKEIKAREYVDAVVDDASDNKMLISLELGKIKHMSKNSITMNQIADMILDVKNDLKEFKTETVQNFVKINQRLDVLEDDVSVLKQDVTGLKQDVNELKHDVNLIKSCPTIKKEINKL